MPVQAPNLVHDHLLQVRPHHAQHLFWAEWKRMAAQIPPATNGNLGRDWGMPKSTRMMQDGSYLGEALEEGWGSGQSYQFHRGTAGRLQFCHGAIVRAPILVYFSRQGLRWPSQTTCTMLYCLIDNIWTSFVAIDAPKSAEKKFKALWMKNSYQGLRAADPREPGRG